jgi:hypothetical protein
MGRLCYPTQAPGRVLVPRVLGATKLSRCAPYERSEIGGARRRSLPRDSGGAVFAITAHKFVNVTSIAVQGICELEIYHRY